MPSRSYILQAFTKKPWAILPEKYAALEDVVMRHLRGEKLTEEEIEARIHGAVRPEMRIEGFLSNDDAGKEISKKVAIVPLFGTIFPRSNMMTMMSGATSAELFGKDFDKLVADPEIDAIVLDVDSPGGYVSGIEELTDKIYNARGTKPIIAVANHMIASAAFWVASAADEVVASPSSKIGSVGIFAGHADQSKAYEQEGIKITLISAGEHKVEGNPYEPLGDEARAEIQRGVDEVYEKFVSTLARNRGISTEKVNADFGQGRMIEASRAVALGMADRIATLDDVIAEQFGANTVNQPSANNANASSALAPSATDIEKTEQAERLQLKVSQILKE